MAEKIEVIADMHYTDAESDRQELIQLLDRISHTANDVFFLGDIFDLWIALPKYETELQRCFIDWCKAQQGKRRIYFVEGNHEYYVVDKYKDVFFACSQKGLFINKVYFTHGHLIQGNCFSFNHLFDRVAKNSISRLVMKIMPYGKHFAKYLQNLLGHKGGKKFNPQRILLEWMARMPYARCVIGHFHQDTALTNAEKKLQIVYGRANVELE